MGKKPLIGWVGLCGVGILMTGCGCCNTQGRREGQPFAGGRAEASAGWTNKMNRQSQNSLAGNPTGNTDSISGMSPGTVNQFNNAGAAGNGWGANQGMNPGGGMAMPNGGGGMAMPSGGGTMSPMGGGTPTSFNGGPMQPSGGMPGAANTIPGIPANARLMGSSRTPTIEQTGGVTNDSTGVVNAAGSQPVNATDSGVHQAMAINSDMNTITSLPPSPPASAASSSSNWSSSGATTPPPAPPLSPDPALSNSPPPVNSMSTKGLPASGPTGSSNGLGSYLNNKNP